MTIRQSSALRALLRAALVCATAFGLGLSPEQVAAVQLVAEAALQAWAQFRGGERQ